MPEHSMAKPDTYTSSLSLLFGTENNSMLVFSINKQKEKRTTKNSIKISLLWLRCFHRRNCVLSIYVSVMMIHDTDPSDLIKKMTSITLSFFSFSSLDSMESIFNFPSFHARFYRPNLCSTIYDRITLDEMKLFVRCCYQG